MRVYTDGACRVHTTKQGGWAYYGPQLDLRCSGTEDDATNSRMELKAIEMAIAAMIASRVQTFTIVTDSANCIGWLSKDWRRKVKRIDIICKVIEEMISLNSLHITFEWVRAHGTDPHNAVVDQMAQTASNV